MSRQRARLRGSRSALARGVDGGATFFLSRAGIARAHARGQPVGRVHSSSHDHITKSSHHHIIISWPPQRTDEPPPPPRAPLPVTSRRVLASPCALTRRTACFALMSLLSLRFVILAPRFSRRFETWKGSVHGRKRKEREGRGREGKGKGEGKRGERAESASARREGQREREIREPRERHGRATRPTEESETPAARSAPALAVVVASVRIIGRRSRSRWSDRSATSASARGLDRSRDGV